MVGPGAVPACCFKLFKVKFDFKFKLYGGRQIEKSGNEVSCGQE